MKNIGILGAGKIGSTIHAYLKTTEHNVTVADKFGSDDVQALDVFNKKELGEILNIYGSMVAKGEWKDYAICC